MTEEEARALFRRLHHNKRNGYERGDCHCHLCVGAVGLLAAYFGFDRRNAKDGIYNPAALVREAAISRGWCDEEKISELKKLQRESDFLDAHLVEIGPDRFWVAHTDEERHSGMDLSECDLHEWLHNQGGAAPMEPGLYVATIHQPDGYSESYRGGQSRYDFEEYRP